MSINFMKVSPILAACVTTGGIIFQIGRHSERLDVVGLKVEAQEKKGNLNHESIFEILGTVNLLKSDTENIKQDIREIKDKLCNIR